MGSETPPRRSKTQIAKSFLGRSSRKDDDNDSTVDPSGRSSMASDSNLSISSSSRPRHRPHLSTTMSPQTLAEINRNRQSIAADTSPVPDTATTLEQSVRLFRHFESLRNGDTTAISKALKEQDPPQGTTLLHLAIQCADVPVIEFIISHLTSGNKLSELNARDKDGNTPLHTAARLGRANVVTLLLDHSEVNDSITNLKGETPLDVAYSPEIFQHLQLAKSIFIDANVQQIHSYVSAREYPQLEKLLNDSRVRSALDINGTELATDKLTIEAGGTLLHEAARKKDEKLIQLLLMNGVDPFKRDKKGKLPQDLTKDDRIRYLLKKSPAAEAAQRSVQEKTILGSPVTPKGNTVHPSTDGGKESREMKGYLKKWTNYTGGWKLRWFVLEEGVLSYYKHQDDAGAACRGAINMRIARLNMDPQDKLRFEIIGKSSVKYHLRANHQVEAKRWYWALNNAIQWTKDEDKEEQRRVDRESEALKNAKEEQASRRDDASSVHGSIRHRSGTTQTALAPPTFHTTASSIADDEENNNLSRHASSAALPTRVTSRTDFDTYDADEMADDISSHEPQPTQKDAMNITAQSLKMQLDLLAQVSKSLNDERKQKPNLSFSDPLAVQAMGAYESAVGNLKALIGDLLRIAHDRDAYWQYRLEQETNMRRMWEESMAKVAKEQEVLESQLGLAEDKRKRTKRALRGALENLATSSQPNTPALEDGGDATKSSYIAKSPETEIFTMSRKPTIKDLAEELSDNDSDDDDVEFFDAVDAGEVEIVDLATAVEQKAVVPTSIENSRDQKLNTIKTAFIGYEDPIRKRLKMDADNRPKISLWGVLKSMIGKDMTKMTLPVTFNEPTSLLQRICEAMEYPDLLDQAAGCVDSTERMVYVAAFAASEFASATGRVAKPFNPLLGETYEYVRPDKKYRFFIEQVSHHPPIGACYAESPTWDYYGEANVQSKFYGKSFDINHLGTWYLNLRPTTGGNELYTWKKVTTSVIGIITGSPTIDMYGTMEINNHKTGEKCILEFKPRGWTKGSAYIVNGRVVDSAGKTRWSMGGHWNDKIYARLTPGYEDSAFDSSTKRRDNASIAPSQAFLVWEVNPRPAKIPFFLTPFGLTLNAIPDRLKPYLAPTDTRLRPDQRAMEDGEYDFAASEKTRLEEKQRTRRRLRERNGEEFTPKWFKRAKCSTTGESYWLFNGEYWKARDRVATGKGKWENEGLEDIFSEKPVE